MSRRMIDNIQWVKREIALALVLSLAFASSVVFAAGESNPNSTTLPNGANLEVDIDNPLNDQELKVPAAAGPGATIPVPIAGNASVGEGVPNIHITFVIDVSGSTTFSDCPGFGNILDCEKQSVLNVLGDANITSVADVGVSVFGESGDFADMSGVSGQQPNTSVIADAGTVVNSVVDGGVNQFTVKNVGNNGTNYTAGLQAALNSVSASAAATKRVFFLSDGASNLGGGGFAAAVAAFVGVAQIDAFSIAVPGGCNAGTDGTLQAMANATGGSCVVVNNPEELLNLLPDLISTMLNDVRAAVDGSDVATNTNPAVPVDGPQTVDYDATPALGIGDYDISATADGSDNAGSASITADSVTIHLLQLTAIPAFESNDLNFDDSHTVTAEILGGSGPDRNIDFVVGGQNAATATPGNASILASVNTPVDFVYTVPQDCASLGLDTITVSTVIGGMSDAIILQKEWIDTVPPDVSCDPSDNPNGNEPQAPGQGQNEDGFYQLNAEDPNLANCTVTLQVEDGDGFIFPGPFAPGDIIKYTQDDTLPQEQKKIGSGNGQAGAVRYHLIGHGDLTITATDPSGNSSTAVCLVPQPPK